MQLYQQRDFGEKINATFQYAIQQMRSLGAALLYIVGPLALGSGIASGVMQARLFSTPTGAPNPSDAIGIIFGGSIGLFITVYFLTLFTGLVVSLVVYSHLKIYARTNGGPVTVQAVWQEVLASLAPSILVGMITVVLAFGALLFLILPGIYLGVVFSLALPIVVFEHPGIGRTLGRCFELIRDKWWSTLGLLFIMGIIVYVLSLVFNAPLLILNLLKTMQLTGGTSQPLMILLTIISTVGGSILSALMALALAFQYFNLVERQEGRGLLSAIDSIGTVPTQPRADDEGDY